VVDVSACRRAEEFRTAVTENMVEGLYALDANGFLTYMNSAAYEMLGWTEGELAGRNIHQTVHFQSSDGKPICEEDCPLTRVRLTGEVLSAVHDTFTRRDGTALPVTYSAAPLAHAEHGQGVVVVFRDATRERADQLREERELDALHWLGRTREAIDEDRLLLYEQPVVPLAAGEPAVELLLRMRARDGDIILPSRFLPVAEKYGLIAEIDRWIISRAVRLAAQGRRVDVNVSAKSMDTDMLAYIKQEIALAGAEPARLVFEVTETALMSDIAVGERFARGVTELGCGLALDDFGTGFASLTYLRRLPFEYLKIDIEFVRDLAENDTNRHLVKAIVALARGLGQQTIAEGVEDETTLAVLRDIGVDFAQGFHLGRPSPVRGLDPRV
jgi:PAS domain S-box-containing protein